MNWYLKVLKQYADFEGRARRTEFWMFFLFNFIFNIVASLIDYSINSNLFYSTGLFSLLYSLFVLIPYFSVSVRRLHDTGKSGWMLLISFIPIIGVIWLIILFATAGNNGPNEYGPDPKDANNEGNPETLDSNVNF